MATHSHANIARQRGEETPQRGVDSAPFALGKGRVLVVDDDLQVLRATTRVLRAGGYDVMQATDGAQAVELAKREQYDAILSDISMPGMDGIQLLHEVREHDLHVPVILITGKPALATAMQALDFGALKYLVKPASAEEITSAVGRAVQLHRMAHVREQAAELLGTSSALGSDRAGIEASFDRALDSLWIAYQPIVAVSDRSVYGFEALLRSEEPSLPHPGAVLDAAERLSRVHELGRTIRRRAASAMLAAPERGYLFVNLHPTDLLDADLWSTESGLTSIADHVVLEITERASLDMIKDVRNRIATLRELGFRIAVDDLGAGYAGLTSFALLEPEIAKLDMSLVRDVHVTPVKQKIIRSMTQLSKDMGMLVVAEGVETPEERDTLVELGCDLLQGYHLGRPGRPFPEAKW